MRKLLIAIAFLSFGSAHAAGYGVAGCGLGSIVFKDEKGPVQIIAATLNGTGVQTFGITTGTSNCNDGANLIKAYIETNHEAIKTAAARGQGEALVGLAKVYNCQNTEALSSALRTNYNNVFNSSSATQTQSGIESVIRMNPELNTSCGNLS
ncbi:MAG: DUF3015 family protein [Bdellovibrionota bacterium]